MKKFMGMILLLGGVLWGSSLSKLFHYYEDQSYEKGCAYGKKYYSRNINNEKYLTLYGLSCLETNHIDRIAKPMLHLSKSESSRENASYFATILLQKQLLKQRLMDNKELGDLRLPKTNFVLSRIFEMFVAKVYTQKGEVYHLDDPIKEDIHYEVYIKKSKKRDYMVIDIYQGDRFTKRYRYD